MVLVMMGARLLDARHCGRRRGRRRRLLLLGATAKCRHVLVVILLSVIGVLLLDCGGRRRTVKQVRGCNCICAAGLVQLVCLS